jgi:SNF2 family DNA or RNA helicase
VPGSGKTTVALAVFQNAKNIGRVEKLMVIGPASCFMPWEEEWTACYGEPPRAMRLVGDASFRARVARRLTDYDMLLCTYQMAHREVELLTEVLGAHDWMVVLDESHNIKRYEGGAWAEAVTRLSPFAKKRMILSGTPVPRSLQDIWTQFTFLWPSQSLLGSRARFEEIIRDEGIDGVSTRLRPFFHRTRKQDLGLPTPVVSPVLLEPNQWPPIQRKIVRILETRTLSDLRTLDFSNRDIETIRSWRRSRIIRLLQAASNPGLLAGRTLELGDPGPPPANDPALEDIARHYNTLETSAKISHVVAKARELVGKGRKVVIWTWFIGNIKLLEHLLDDLRPLTAYGEVKPFEEDEDTVLDESRERNIRFFRTDPQRCVLIANPSACSESISLHKECHDAIYVERTFNCGQFIQSMDRIHRVGMPPGETATYYLPIMNCSIDRLFDSRLLTRQ